MSFNFMNLLYSIFLLDKGKSKQQQQQKHKLENFSQQTYPLMCESVSENILSPA